MSTEDDQFIATGPDFVGLYARPEDHNQPAFPFGGAAYGNTIGLLGFANNDGPIQQNSYSKSAGVSGGSEDSTGVVGVSLRHPGVYGQVEDSPQVPGGLLAGVLGVASTQPGVIGFARDGEGVQGASFTGTAFAPCRSSAQGCKASRARSPASPAFPVRRDRRRSPISGSPPAFSAHRAPCPASSARRT
jgi:hypothetical protein